MSFNNLTTTGSKDYNTDINNHHSSNRQSSQQLQHPHQQPYQYGQEGSSSSSSSNSNTGIMNGYNIPRNNIILNGNTDSISSSIANFLNPIFNEVKTGVDISDSSLRLLNNTSFKPSGFKHNNKFNRQERLRAINIEHEREKEKQIRDRLEKVLIVPVSHDSESSGMSNKESCGGATIERKKKSKKKQSNAPAAGIGNIQKSSLKPFDESADLSNSKTLLSDDTDESGQEGGENNMNGEKLLINGFSALNSKSGNDEGPNDEVIWISGEAADKIMDKDNSDSDSSNVMNGNVAMDEEEEDMTLVKRKRKRCTKAFQNKQNAASLPAPPPAPINHSQSLPDNNKNNNKKTRQKIRNNKTEPKLAPLKIQTASFDMENDFPPLSAASSASSKQENAQISFNHGAKRITPSKSDSVVAEDKTYELVKNDPVASPLRFSQSPQRSWDNPILSPASEKQVRGWASIDNVTPTSSRASTPQKLNENLIKEKSASPLRQIKNQDLIYDKPTSPAFLSKNEGRRTPSVGSIKQKFDPPSRGESQTRGAEKYYETKDSSGYNSEKNFSNDYSYRKSSRSEGNSYYRGGGGPRHGGNAYHGPRKPRFSNNYQQQQTQQTQVSYSTYQNNLYDYSYQQPQMAHVPYIPNHQHHLHQPQPHEMYPVASGVGYHPIYAQFPPVAPHMPTGFVPQQSYIPMQLPFLGANGEPLQQQQSNYGYDISNPYFTPPHSVISLLPYNLPQQTSHTPEGGASRGSTPVAEYNGQRPPSVPVTIAETKMSRSSSVPNFMAEGTTKEIFKENVEKYALQFNEGVSSETQGVNRGKLRYRDPTTSTSSGMFHKPTPPPSIDTLVFSPKLEKTIKEALYLQDNESVFYVMVTNEQGQHTRQMRVLMNNMAPVKFDGFPTPLLLNPKVGPAGQYSQAGYYYAKREKIRVSSAEHHAQPMYQNVTNYHPVYSFSATIPPEQRLAHTQYHFKDLFVIPKESHPSQNYVVNNGDIPSNEAKFEQILSPSVEPQPSHSSKFTNNTSAQNN